MIVDLPLFAAQTWYPQVPILISAVWWSGHFGPGKVRSNIRQARVIHGSQLSASQDQFSTLGRPMRANMSSPTPPSLSLSFPWDPANLTDKSFQSDLKGFQGICEAMLHRGLQYTIDKDGKWGERCEIGGYGMRWVSLAYMSRHPLSGQ